MIYLLLGTCWRCEYQAKVGVGWSGNATVPVHWAPANRPSCGLVSVNVADLSPGKEARCHECDATVELDSQSGVMPEPRTARRAPAAAS